MATLFYSLILYLLVPVALLRLAVRGLRNPAYWRRWPERFGFVPAIQPAGCIWVHAVSVGETRAAVPLVRALMQQYPGRRILITTMTPTGSRQVRELLDNEVEHCYVPYDLPTAVRRFLVRTRPQLALIMETELWPNLFRACQARGIPLVLANVRMSEKSAHGYRRFAAITRATLAAVSRLGAQSEPDAGRMRELGAPQVVVTGSVKFEITVPDGLETQARALRAGIGQRPVWVAGSTRDGEESLVLAAFARLRERFPDLLLILVPRHPERFEAVTRLCRQQGYAVQRRSEAGSRMAPDTAIFVGDTMGELLLFYSAADVAFVGGSLLPLGGQNPLEACVVGTPVVFGPHMFNFSEISRLLLERGAGRQVPDSAALARVVGDYLADSALRERAGAAGRQLVADNRGALDRTLALVQSVLPP